MISRFHSINLIRRRCIKRDDLGRMRKLFSSIFLAPTSIGKFDKLVVTFVFYGFIFSFSVLQILVLFQRFG